MDDFFWKIGVFNVVFVIGYLLIDAFLNSALGQLH